MKGVLAPEFQRQLPGQYDFLDFGEAQEENYEVYPCSLQNNDVIVNFLRNNQDIIIEIHESKEKLIFT